MFDCQNDDEGEYFEGLYENGHWDWNNHTQGLIFISDLTSKPNDVKILPPATIIGPIQFKDDIGLIEQQRFKKRYQRKSSGETDVVFLQDIKDIVIYTAPISILNKSVINILHTSAADRFLRASIFYFQYYLQIADEMNKRILDLENKIRTKNSIKTESVFRDNLQDLRLLITKEYCNILLGAEEYKKYHHLGPKKKSRSMSKKESVIFESVLRISIQIIWVALGRKKINEIELEMHRIFKSKIFNMAEHKLAHNYKTTLTLEELCVLQGHCFNPNNKKLNMRAPLMNELTCHRDVSFMVFGLGVVKYSSLASRFSKSTGTARTQKLYDDIYLPPQDFEEREHLPEYFPTESYPNKTCNHQHRLKWLARITRLRSGRRSAKIRHP
ncbi:uncharacterized protein LOC131853333 isoform X2 [Achroia grisella]|uniref:uncharacterized protein LOC131853333 isoform X2 n=1 Tax=Achroia grisella TaxID=688607 RepID=UPI0027D2D11D|nr:uncharacterized protein LOC131853333 isoform X2 [Achroia grisella]